MSLRLPAKRLTRLLELSRTSLAQTPIVSSATCRRRRAQPSSARLFTSSSTTSSKALQPSLRSLPAQFSSQSQGEVSTIHTSSSLEITAPIRSIRSHAKVTFLALSDGSLPAGEVLQAVLRGGLKETLEGRTDLTAGATVRLRGRLQQSKGRGQSIEFVAEEGEVVGKCDIKSHPLLTSSPGSDVSDLARRNAHLRSQLPSFGSTLRLRDRLESGMSQWFLQQDFVRCNPPLLTGSDCEGAGEVFKVIDGTPSNERAAANAGTAPATSPTASAAYLTVSSQLHLEALTLGLGRTYTFTPAFRAEDSATSRHLREFWMCEAEMITQGRSATEELEQVITVVEDVVKAGARRALGLDQSSSSAATDAAYLHSDGNTLEDLGRYFSDDSSWARITYSKALSLLVEQHAKEPFQSAPAPAWGEGLASEHEKWLAGEHAQGPVFVTDYPAESKPFYMRRGTDEESGRPIAHAFDLLVPGIGELVGGSLREDDPAILLSSMKSSELVAAEAKEVPEDHPLYWYIRDLRTYGMGPHGGFGLGVERLVMWLAGRDSVRDCIPFPRVGRRVRF